MRIMFADAGREPVAACQQLNRVEMKYILTPAQTAFLTEKLRGHMEVDQYGLTSIASLYYDTPDHRLVRASLEKPPFKEKIRLRSYGIATEETPVFLELKRKAEGTVYKRRVRTTIPLVREFFEGGGDIFAGTQINSELKAFRDHYQTLVPVCLIIYERTAYREPDSDLRLTIDADPRYRTENLNLVTNMDGIPLLPPGYGVLEIKVQDAMPLWLAKILSEGAVYKDRFSKYGEAYKQQMCRCRATQH